MGSVSLKSDPPEALTRLTNGFSRKFVFYNAMEAGLMCRVLTFEDIVTSSSTPYKKRIA
jgi:hypothetical protein